MTKRIEKVNSLLGREIGSIIQREVFFPDNVLVTLTHVDATANLIEAKVYISAYFTRRNPEGEGGPEEMGAKVIKILNKNVYNIQQEVNKKLKMRPIPKIIFVLDKSEAEAGRIEELLAKLKKD